MQSRGQKLPAQVDQFALLDAYKQGLHDVGGK